MDILWQIWFLQPSCHSVDSLSDGVLNSDHSIIVERSKGKQTYLHSISLKNQILRYVHYIAYNNICFLKIYGKGIAIILRWVLSEKLFLNLLENKIQD